jgi:hypothetical protein
MAGISLFAGSKPRENKRQDTKIRETLARRKIA